MIVLNLPTVRPLQLSDLEYLEAQFPQPSEGAHRRRLEMQRTNQCSYICIEHGGSPAGILLIRWNGSTNGNHRKLSPYPEIGSLFIQPEFRGQGLASLLHEHAEALIKAKSIKGAGLVIKNDNTASIRLHTKLGYKPIGPAHPTTNDPDKPRTYYAKQLE